MSDYPDSFSDKDLQYIRQHRKFQTLTRRKDVEALIEAAGYPVYEPVVNYQVLYGGLELMCVYPMELSLIWPASVQNSTETVYELESVIEHQGEFYFVCCRDYSANLGWYVIDRKGAIHSYYFDYERLDPEEDSAAAWIASYLPK